MHGYGPFESSASSAPSSLKYALLAAGIYNLLWGAAVILLPQLAFELTGMQPPRYPQIWQCVGMIVGVYGIGYLIASRDPFRHWPIVLVGLAGKVLGPIGFMLAAARGDLPISWGAIIVFNDLIWWIPFGLILFAAFRFNSNTSFGNPHELDDALLLFPSNHGNSLMELSRVKPLMVVFLRHFGCTFCREALQDLARSRKRIEQLGVQLAVVHMCDVDKASQTLKRYGLEGLEQFSDGTCEIYRAFDLRRGSFRQLFGLKVVWRGIAATLKGNLLGALTGDGFRMPGVFFLHKGDVHGCFRHHTAADRPDYYQLAERFIRSIEGDSGRIPA